MKRQSLKYKHDYESKRIALSKELTTIECDNWKKEIVYNCSPFTVTQLPAMLDLVDTVEDIIVNDIPGDFVECGVYMGGSCMIMAGVLNHYNVNRTIWLFDTFDGVPTPYENDTTPEGESLKDWFDSNKLDNNNQSNWCYSSYDTVKENFAECNYKGESKFIIGKVEDTIPSIMPDSISLLRIDVDLANSTRHVMDEMYPLLSSGGHLILDDYGYFPAVKETIDDYFKDDPKTMKYITVPVRRIVK